MSQKHRSGTALAVQFVGDELRIAKVKLGSNAGVLASATLPLPEGGVRDGEIMDLESMQYTLSSAVSLPEFRGVRQVIFSIMSMQVLASEATLPHVRSEKALDRMLRANLDEYFPVSVSDHAITWLRAATAGETGLQQDRVLLWAIPREMLNGYYLLANRCGLSVKAIDYAGADLAAAAGAVYAETEQKKGRKKARRHKKTGNFVSDEMALEGADARDAGGSAEIHICAETDDMLITFVREGTVRLQRIVRRSGLSEDLAECAMMLEYYASRNVNDQVGRAVLAGGCAREEGLADALSDVLGCRVESPVVYPGPEWIAHLGACTNRIDFGDASMNHPGGFAGVTKVWQYGLIAAAGALLLASILFLCLRFEKQDIELIEKREEKQTLRGTFSNLMKNRNYVFFLLALSLSQGMMLATDTAFSLYSVDLGISDAFYGYAFGSAIVMEFLLMLFFWKNPKESKMKIVLFVGAIAQVIRPILFAIPFQNPNTYLFFACLRGVSMGFYLLAQIDILRNIVGDELLYPGYFFFALIKYVLTAAINFLVPLLSESGGYSLSFLVLAIASFLGLLFLFPMSVKKEVTQKEA